MSCRFAHLTLVLALAAATGEARPSVPAPVHAGRYAEEIAQAQACLDAFMAAFNKRDLKAWEATFNFPHVRFAAGKVTVLQPGEQTADLFTTGALSEWDHSTWSRRDVIHAGPDKVHIDTRFNRYRKDGSLIGGFDSIYIVTRQGGHWGIQARSSFAP
jgi:hypothetical protein